MKLGPVIHGALLAVALIAAYGTLKHQKAPEQTAGKIVVWNMPVSSITTVTYDSHNQTVRIERRHDKTGSYLWGTVTHTRPAPKKPAAKKPAASQNADSSPAAKGKAQAKGKTPAKAKQGAKGKTPAKGAKTADAKATPKTPAGKNASTAADTSGQSNASAVPNPIISRVQFPVGEGGQEVLKSVAKLHALRNLGVLNDKQKTEYKLADTKDQLSVFFKGTKNKSHSLMLGGRVYGSSDRYALDPDTGKGYVIAFSVLHGLESGQVMLRLHKYHGFKPDDVASVVVDAGKQTRKLLRKSTHDKTGTHVQWSYAKTPDKPDQTLANFVERTNRLTPRTYKPKLDEKQLEHVLTLRYLDKSGKKIGYLELYKREPTGAAAANNNGPLPKADYFLKTDQTRVFGEVGKLTGQRVEQDISDVFGNGGASASKSSSSKSSSSKSSSSPVKGAAAHGASAPASPGTGAAHRRTSVVPVRRPAAGAHTAGARAAHAHAAAPAHHAAAPAHHAAAPKRLSPLHPAAHPVPHKPAAKSAPKAPASR